MRARRRLALDLTALALGASACRPTAREVARAASRPDAAALTASVLGQLSYPTDVLPDGRVQLRDGDWEADSSSLDGASAHLATIAYGSSRTTARTDCAAQRAANCGSTDSYATPWCSSGPNCLDGFRQNLGSDGFAPGGHDSTQPIFRRNQRGRLLIGHVSTRHRFHAPTVQARSMQPATIPRFRVARPSRDLEAATRFYTKGLGLELLASFSDHAGFDGVILGHETWPYHLEFTRRRGAPVAPRSTDEDLLVFYLPEQTEWNAASQRLEDAGGRAVSPSNPYWNEHGVTFEDPDGYLIVLQNAAWP